jgi:hypothetical protein
LLQKTNHLLFRKSALLHVRSRLSRGL